MRDGVTLEATIKIPYGSPPSSGFPGIVLVHGYGGSKDDVQSVASIFSLVNGYATLAYSVRGQGKSGGLSTTAGEAERLDLLEVIGFFRTVPKVSREDLAVMGASQGGIHAWMAAAYRMPGVKVVAPAIATPHFAGDLVPNGCVKKWLVHEITLGSVRYGPERDKTKDLIIRDAYDSLLQFIDQRDLERIVDSVKVPVIQGLGWADVLFPVNSAIRAAANLSRRGIPIWSYYGTNGHQEPLNMDEATFLLTKVIAWFDYWLKGRPLGQANDPLVFYADDRVGWPHHISTGWPPRPEGMVRFYLTGNGLTTSLPSRSESFSFSLEYDSSYTPAAAWNDEYSGTRFQNAFRSTPVRFVSPELLDTADVTGIPRAHLVVSSDAAQFQAHIRLYDVSRSDTGLVWKPMTRGNAGVRGNTPHAPREVNYECDALSHYVPRGHFIGVEITSLDLFSPDNAQIIPYFLTAHSTVMASPSHPSYVDVPLVGTANIAGLYEPVDMAPGDFVLLPNYPNPFNPSTVIRFSLHRRLHVTLSVFDILGRPAARLLDGVTEPGEYSLRFHGEGLASGTYFYELAAGGRVQTRKMLLVR